MEERNNVTIASGGCICPRHGFVAGAVREQQDPAPCGCAWVWDERTGLLEAVPSWKANTVSKCRCLHCNYKWLPRTTQRPGVCPRCKSYNWDKEPQRRGKERTMTTDHYTIDPTKLTAITASVQASRPMTEAQVRDFVLADWPEGAEHQQWLDSAPVSEIADWVVTGNLEQFLATPGAYHEAWARIWDDIDGEYLSGTIESVPDDQTFVVRAVPSGRLWVCRHDLYGEVLEAEVIAGQQ